MKTVMPCFLIVLMLVLTACGPGVNPSTTVPAETLVPSAAPTVMQPTITSTLEAITQAPACTFPLAQTTTEDAPPDSYTFSQPKLVFTGMPDIAGWLPDSQNVIIMPVKSIDFWPHGNEQTIELFNPESKETQVYAIRRQDVGMPAWNSELKAIVYQDTKMIGTQVEDAKYFSQLRISHGDPDNTQLLADDLQIQLTMVRPDGSQIVYLQNSGKQTYRLYGRMLSAGTLEAEQLIPFDSAQFGQADYPIPYNLVWRKGTSQIFFHSYYSSTDKTILVDVDSGKSCTLSFNGWVYFARWSPDGRYLAVIKSPARISPWDSFDLGVLDAQTGKLYQMDTTKVDPAEMKDCCRHLIEDLSWAPDNHHLVITGTAAMTGTTTYVPVDRLYLVDFLSGDVDALFPSYQFNTDRWGTSLAWSPDGTKLLARCSIEKQGRLCLISVKSTARP